MSSTTEHSGKFSHWIQQKIQPLETVESSDMGKIKYSALGILENAAIVDSGKLVHWGK